MNLITIVFTAFALAMDAFAVSVTKGITVKNLTKKIAIKIALFFGIFQAIMPVIGWFLGIGFSGYIEAIDHWIALVLLSILGGKMIYDFFKEYKEEKENKNNSGIESEVSITLENDYSGIEISDKELITLAIATSIDALAIGISFAFLQINIIVSSLIIGLITFVLCFIGVITGKKLGGIFKDYAELIGGIVLILIGINIFNEHTEIITNFILGLF